jgi:hypothetical protein
MDILLGRESYDDDSAVGSTGEFVALQSFSGSDASGDESTVHMQRQRPDTRNKKKLASTRKTLPINGTPGKFNDIGATQSNDSAVYNDGSCGVCVSNLFGWHPKNVVIKVAVSKPGMPHLQTLLFILSQIL